jgi:hypothetical protein
LRLEPFTERRIPVRLLENSPQVTFVGKYRDVQQIPSVVTESSINILNDHTLPLVLNKEKIFCINTARPRSDKYPQIQEFNNPPHLRKFLKLSPLDMSSFKLKHLENIERKAVVGIISDYAHVFARSDLDIGPGFRHPIPYKINRTTDHPQPRKYLPVAEAHKDFLEEHIRKLEEQKVVKRVNNLEVITASLVIVKKPNGKLRCCLDLRPTNNITNDDKNYPLPPLQSILQRLAGNKYYTSLDLVSAYHQFPLHTDDQKHYSFLSPSGVSYVYTRCPFGGRLITSFLQSLTSNVLAKNEPNIATYVDDISLFSNDLEGRKRLVRKFLNRLSDAN